MILIVRTARHPPPSPQFNNIRLSSRIDFRPLNIAMVSDMKELRLCILSLVQPLSVVAMDPGTQYVNSLYDSHLSESDRVGLLSMGRHISTAAVIMRDSYDLTIDSIDYTISVNVRYCPDTRPVCEIGYR